MKNLISYILLLISSSFANATDTSNILHSGMAYNEAKQALVAQGWTPLKNRNINDSSLYAQEVYGQGLVEVVDCISMELDGCQFRFSKGNQVLELKTITRQLTLDTFKLIKK